MSDNHDVELKLLKERLEEVEKEVGRLRKIIEPATYQDWWHRLDTNW